MKTGIVKDDRYMEHNMGAFHVENPKRLEVIYDMIDKEISFPLENIPPRQAEDKEVLWIHTSSYLERIKDTAGKNRVVLDPDTSTSARSYEVALLAVGGLLESAEAVQNGKIQNGFALVRPPGHHAEAQQAMGFCLFNNVAVAAEYLLKKHGLKRLLIADWDLHHGNGTQHSFYSRDDVLYFSTHQFPHYPGTGHWSEVGEGRGEGFTVNIPLYAGKGDSDYRAVFQNLLSPIAAEYKPDFILVSAGFDIYQDDPLGGMNVSSTGFGALTRDLMDLAETHCDNRILFTLEGGYDLQGLRDGVKQVLLQMSGNAADPDIEAKSSPALEKDIQPVFETQRKFWKF
ncbi:MAG: histone deacetylase [Candidatus Aminicenantes bacterium]|jgi:acetoin utilization deacetylase AcuC-like enzyme